MYVCIWLCTFCNRFFSFFAPLGPLGLIIYIKVWHFLKNCGCAAMPRSSKNTGYYLTQIQILKKVGAS